MIAGARFGSTWRWEGKKAKRAKREALRWAMDKDNYKIGDKVSNVSRRKFIITYGDKAMNKILSDYRAAMKSRMAEFLETQ